MITDSKQEYVQALQRKLFDAETRAEDAEKRLGQLQAKFAEANTLITQIGGATCRYASLHFPFAGPKKELETESRDPTELTCDKCGETGGKYIHEGSQCDSSVCRGHYQKVRSWPGHAGEAG